ncbi:MAG: response regulator transcription factor [Limnohabitans sp.]
MSSLLMIEDDVRLAGMVSDYLAASGYQVSHAPDAATGLARLQQAVPELVILDLMLPDMDDLQVCQRIRAVLRRKGGSGAGAHAPALQFGSLEIDRDARRVQVRGQPCELTSYQFDLLVALAERAGRVLTRDQIMEAVRGRELEAFDRSIDVHMGRIRAAIEDDVKNPKRILTVRGVGYVFARQQD